MTISLKKILLSGGQRQGAICCVCGKPFAKYLVTIGNETKVFCNRCIVQFMDS